MIEDCELTMGDDHNISAGRHQELSASIVWTPIPLLTWLFPCVGHIGIVTSTGVLRDFAGPYHVAKDNMGFGEPTKYLPIDLDKVLGGAQGLDNAIAEASDEYKKRMVSNPIIIKKLFNFQITFSTIYYVTIAMISWQWR